MKPTLNVYALPKYVDPEELAGGTAVVIDVLRATTTIVYALEAGATQILPCLEIADALALAEQFSPGEVVLGGEREDRASRASISATRRMSTRPSASRGRR